MGTWGVAIFSDDIASDVRDRYREHLGDGVPDADATRLVLEESTEELADGETAPIVWLALATAQSRVGRLENRVRDEAIRVIDAGTDLPRWRDEPRAMAKRQAALARLRDELIGPQKPRRRIPKPIRSVCPWEPGAIVSFRRDDGRHLLLRVKATHGEHGVSGGRRRACHRRPDRASGRPQPRPPSTESGSGLDAGRERGVAPPGHPPFRTACGGYALPRMRFIVVPQTGHLPFAMRRPESLTETSPSKSRFSLHFTQ